MCTRHPLVRTADRLEAFAILGVLVIALAAIPAALAAGGIVHRSGLQTSQQEISNRHPVQATVVAGVGLPTDLETPASVRVQWQEHNRERTESVAGVATVKPGDQMTIWLDERGKVVAAPMQAGDAQLQAVVAGVAAWTSITMVGALLACVVCRILERSRDRAWDRELRLWAYNDDGWANRPH